MVLEAAKRAGWTIQRSTRYNWELVKGSLLPLILPRLGTHVAVEIVDNALYQSGDDDLRMELFAAAGVLSRKEHEASLAERLDTETGSGEGSKG